MDVAWLRLRATRQPMTISPLHFGAGIKALTHSPQLRSLKLCTKRTLGSSQDKVMPRRKTPFLLLFASPNVLEGALKQSIRSWSGALGSNVLCNLHQQHLNQRAAEGER